MSNLAIIPARGGSKRLKDKNIHPFNGHPLIHFTMVAVLKSNLFDPVLVTSDSDEILEVASQIKDDRLVFEKRARDLATDHATVLDVVNEIVARYANEGKAFDLMGHFLPTAPFRTADDVVKAVKRLDPAVDSVVSITEYDFPPQLALVHESNNLLHSNDPSLPFENNKTRSQDYQKIFRPNGAIYLSWWKSFLVNKNYFAGKVASYFMPKKLSLDIDTELDVLIGEAALKYYGTQLDLV